MPTELGGYRDYKKHTATATTATLNRDQIEEGHKVYLETVGVKGDRNNADCEVYLVTGGQQFLLRHFKNLTSGDGETLRVGAWMYAAEHLRFYWQDIQADDVLEMWALGVDKWEREGEQTNQL